MIQLKIGLDVKMEQKECLQSVNRLRFDKSKKMPKLQDNFENDVTYEYMLVL